MSIFPEQGHRARIRLSIVVYSALSLLVLSAALSNAGANQDAGQGQRVDLLGNDDLQGRESLQVTAKSSEANRDWVYVGQPDNTWDGTQRFNPITKQMERNDDIEVLRSSQLPPHLIRSTHRYPDQ